MSEPAEDKAGLRAAELSVFLRDEAFTPAERKLIFDWKFGHGGGFYLSLVTCIMHADGENIEKLRRGFPETVAAWVAYANGDLMQRVKASYPLLG